MAAVGEDYGEMHDCHLDRVFKEAERRRGFLSCRSGRVVAELQQVAQRLDDRPRETRACAIYHDYRLLQQVQECCNTAKAVDFSHKPRRIKEGGALSRKRSAPSEVYKREKSQH